MIAAKARSAIRLLAYCLMPNHWHMVLWPNNDGEMTEFLRWLTLTHSQRLHAHRHTTGYGHIYQGRFKSFPIEGDESLFKVVRYVERNALRGAVVQLVAREEVDIVTTGLTEDRCCVCGRVKYRPVNRGPLPRLLTAP